MDFANRNPGSESQGDQATDRFRIGHRRAAGLAEIDENLEGLTTIILGDVEEHRAEGGLDTRGDTAKRVRTRPLGAALEVLRLGIEQGFLEPGVLRLELRDSAVQLAALRPAVALRLRQLGRTGGKNLIVARAIAVDRDALALEGVGQLVDRANIRRRCGVRK